MEFTYWLLYSDGAKIGLIIVLLIISALLSASEQALRSANKNSIRQMAEDGDKKAMRSAKLLEDPSHHFSAATICVTFFGFIIFTFATMMISRPLNAYFLARRYDLTSYLIGMALAFLVVTFLFVVLSISFPRQIALHHPEGVLLKMSGFMNVFRIICSPFIAINRAFTSLLLKITRQGGLMKEEEFSEEEVMSMLEAGQESGALKEEGKKMIDSIFAFDDKLAYEIMTPRTDVFLIDIEDEPEEYIDELMEMHYSRIPVCEGDSDNIIGILNIKDYIMVARESGFENVDISEILRAPIFVPDTKNVDSLFFELQKEKQHIAILIDEYGGFSGIVTMEDLIEEIVGDIDDEYDEEEPEIEKVSDTVFYIDGSMDLDDVNEETGARLESEDNETVGGLIIDLLGEIPDDGDERIEVTHDTDYARYEFTIESVRDRRIERVKMEILPPAEDEEEAGEKSNGKTNGKVNGK